MEVEIAKVIIHRYEFIRGYPVLSFEWIGPSNNVILVHDKLFEVVPNFTDLFPWKIVEVGYDKIRCCHIFMREEYI
jgi:hypothetical protein